MSMLVVVSSLDPGKPEFKSIVSALYQSDKLLWVKDSCAIIQLGSNVEENTTHAQLNQRLTDAEVHFLYIKMDKSDGDDIRLFSDAGTVDAFAHFL